MKKILIYIIKAYSVLVSPFLGRNCRYSPTCSAYAVEAITKHGAIKGTWLAIKRVCSCHPWSKRDYHDPPP